MTGFSTCRRAFAAAWWLVLMLTARPPLHGQEEPVKPAAARGPASKEKPGFSRYPFVFRDVGDEAGLFPHVAGIQGHAAGWGDVDGDGWIDLYVATFHTEGAKPNLFFRNVSGQVPARRPGGAAALDARAGVALRRPRQRRRSRPVRRQHAGRKESRLAKTQGHALDPCTLFRNDGGGKFTEHLRGTTAPAPRRSAAAAPRCSTTTATACSTCSSARIPSPATTARRRRARGCSATRATCSSRTCRAPSGCPRGCPVWAWRPPT